MLEQLTTLFYHIVPQAEKMKITEDMRLAEDLGLNSLHFMLLAMALEDTYHLRVPEDASFQTVGDVCSFVETGLR